MQVHLPAPVGDLESVHLGLVQACGASTALRQETGFGNEAEGREPSHPTVARRDRHAVPVRDLLRGQFLLMQRDEDPERVIVEEGLAVFVVQQQFFREQLRSSRRAAVLGRSKERHAADSCSRH